ncbi:Methyltransferase type 11 [Candidatus Roizmanbacteria bacterium]|nr:Methyltransferase type 11 [Candidatus Roizmanbacteria bacterium]
MKKVEFEKMYLLEGSHFWFLGKRYFISSYLNSIKDKIKEILDVGCGTGGTTLFLNKYGRVVGIEKDPFAAKLAKKNKVRVILGSANKLPFKTKKFDLVTYFNVLSHKKINIKKALKEAKRVLKPQTFIIITDNALPILNSNHDHFFDIKKRYYLEEFEKLLNEMGFSIIKSSYIFFFLFPAVFLKRATVNRFINKSDVMPASQIVNFLAGILLKLEALLLPYVKYPIGSSLIILAQKNEKN